MYELKVTPRFLQEHRLLMDWQLRERGIDPAAFTDACLKYDQDRYEQWLEGDPETDCEITRA